jgi:MscS family membrane protein
VTDRVVAWIEHAARAPWTITVVAVVCAFLVGRLLVRLARPVLARLALRTTAAWDDQLIETMSSPLSLALSLQALHLAAPWLPLTPGTLATLGDAIAIATTFAVSWIAFRAIDLAQAVLERRSWAIDRPASRSVLSIAGRLAKVVVVLIACTIALSQLGVAVASLVAGLGIGGLAVALAAQKTLENLFGTLSIGIDQPMREGDLIKVYDTVGTVEQIGLRSTRLRTLDRSVITIPNGDLANQRVESLTLRDRLRLATTIGLVYATTSEQLRAILAELEAILRDHPKIWPDLVVVRLKQLASSSLDIEIMAWFLTADWTELQLIRQDVLLAFMAAIERHGSAIAFPTQTLHLATPTPAAATPAPGRPR